MHFKSFPALLTVNIKIIPFYNTLSEASSHAVGWTSDFSSVSKNASSLELFGCSH